MSSGTGRIVFMTLGVVLLGLALYYVYKWLSGSSEQDDVMVYGPVSVGIPANTSKPLQLTSENLPQIYGGGEVSISTWIYVANWGVQKGKNKVFLTLNGGAANGFETIVMYLGQFQNKLGVRVSHETQNQGNSSATLDSNQMPLIMNGVTPYSDTATDFHKCDIEQVDLQRWVHVCAVLSGRTCDIYIDGKLTRSCVLDGVYKISGGSPTMVLGNAQGFGGFIGKTNVANFAYGPDAVYRIYSNGPMDTGIWNLIKSYFDPSQYSFSLKRNGQDLVAASS